MIITITCHIYNTVCQLQCIITLIWNNYLPLFFNQNLLVLEESINSLVLIKLKQTELIEATKNANLYFQFCIRIQCTVKWHFFATCYLIQGFSKQRFRLMESFLVSSWQETSSNSIQVWIIVIPRQKYS